MKNNINTDDYELILFSKRTTNRAVTKHGFKVGEFLVVGFSDTRNNSWRIYRSKDGLSCLETTFETREDAIQCAEWLREIYEQFFFIWTEYPNAELFRWAYLTVDNGEKYWKIIEELDKQRNVRWEDVCQQLQ